MKVCVVIPTYNENASIRAHSSACWPTGPDYHVLVVDDNSPDDTAAVVAAFARTRPRSPLAGAWTIEVSGQPRPRRFLASTGARRPI